MTYQARFKGGPYHGGALNYQKKIGGYIRLQFESDPTTEYIRVEDNKDYGVYEARQ